MSAIIQRNQPCLDQISCKSSDARQCYEGGNSHCFSCNKTFFANSTYKKTDEEHEDMSDLSFEEVSKYPSRGFKERKLRMETCEFFKVKVGYNSEGAISSHFYPYPEGYKQRKLPKTFSWVGKAGGLFGQALFN